MSFLLPFSEFIFLQSSSPLKFSLGLQCEPPTAFLNLNIFWSLILMCGVVADIVAWTVSKHFKQTCPKLNSHTDNSQFKGE